MVKAQSKERTRSYSIGIGTNSSKRSDPLNTAALLDYNFPDRFALSKNTYGVELRKYNPKSFYFLRGSYMHSKQKEFTLEQTFYSVYVGIAKEVQIRKSNLYFDYGGGLYLNSYSKPLREWALGYWPYMYHVKRYGICSLLALEYKYKRFIINTRFSFFHGLEIQKNDEPDFEGQKESFFFYMDSNSALGININYLF